MKTIRFISSASRKVLLLAVSLLVALSSALAFPARVALAAPPDPQVYVNASSLKHTQKWLSQQESNVAKAKSLVSEYQNLFTEVESLGIDTTAISPALATFQSQLAAADPILSTADGILSTHNGFDNNGNVTDLLAATETIRSARLALQNARTLLMQAGRDYTTSLKSWKTPQVTQIENLQAGLVNVQTWLSQQQTDLGMASVVVANVNSLLTAASSKYSTSGLKTALKTYNAKIVIAQTANTSAVSILSAHTGFDASGNVTNIHDASQTNLAAGVALLTAYNALGRSTGSLSRSLAGWRVANSVPSKSSVYAVYLVAYNSSLKLYNSVYEENGSRISNLDTRFYQVVGAFSKIP